MQVLVLDYSKPETSISIGNVPEPTGQEGNVHAPGGQNPKTALVLGFAYIWPADHVVLLLIMLAIPVEAGLNFGDLLVDRFMEVVETHKEQKETGEGIVDENSPGRLR